MNFLPCHLDSIRKTSEEEPKDRKCLSRAQDTMSSLVQPETGSLQVIQKSSGICLIVAMNWTTLSKICSEKPDTNIQSEVCNAVKETFPTP